MATKFVTKRVEEDIKYDLQGPISDVIERLEGLRARGDVAGDAYISIDMDYEYGEQVIEATLSWKRPETDDERKARLHVAKVSADANRTRELAELARLQEKYPDDTA